MSDVSDSKAEKWSASPCACCKIRRKKCSEKCLLAPYFPRHDLQKFLFVRSVFGNSNVIRLLQSLPAEQRGDAVSSLVHEARERFRDPVLGCVGEINDLQKKLADLQLQLLSTEAELANMRLQLANLTLMIRGGYHEGRDPNTDSATLLERQEKHMNPPVSEAELANMRLQHANLNLMIRGGYHEGRDPNFDSAPLLERQEKHMNPPVSDDEDPVKLWEQFWT